MSISEKQNIYNKRKIQEYTGENIYAYDLDREFIFSIIEEFERIATMYPKSYLVNTDEELRIRIESYEQAKAKRIERLEKELELLKNGN